VLDVLRGGGPRPEMTATADSSGDTSLQGAAAEKVAANILDAPADLRSIVRRAMATAPANRYPNARAFGDDLRRFLSGTPVDAHKYSARERTGRWLAAHRRLTTAALGVVVTLFLATMIFLLREATLREAAEASSRSANAARIAAETERARADAQSLALLEEQGRSELNAQRPFRAAPLLAEAFRRAPTDRRIRWLLTEALHPVESLESNLDVRVGSPADNSTYSIALSRDGTAMLTGHTKDFALWDARSGALHHRWLTPGWFANLPRFSDDGTRFLNIAVTEGPGAAKVMDPATGRELSNVPVSPLADFLTWSGDGRFVAAVFRDGRLEIWSTKTGSVLHRLKAGSQPVFNCMAFSPDGSTLAVRGTNALLLVSTATGVVRSSPLAGDDIQVIVYSFDGTRIAATLTDRSIRIWDAATLKLQRRFGPLAKTPTFLSFSADGLAVVAVDFDSAQLWDVDTATRLTSFEEQGRAQPVAIAWSPTEPRLFTVVSNGAVRIWHLRRSTWAEPLPGHRTITRGAYLSDGRIAMLDSDDPDIPKGDLRIWSPPPHRLVSRVPVAWNAAFEPSFSRDGSRVAIAVSMYRVAILDAATGTPVLSRDLGQKLDRLALSPDGTRVAVATRDGALHVFANGGSDAAISRRDPGHLMGSLAFDPSGNELLWASGPGDAQVLDATSGQTRIEVPRHGKHAIYSADGTRFFIGGLTGEDIPTIWDARTGAQVSLLQSNGEFVSGGALNHDGTLAATLSEDGTVRIWDGDTGHLLRTINASARGTLPGPVGLATVAFSPRGDRLLVANGDAVLVWNIEVDQRTPDEVEKVVAAKSPWRLVEGRLVLP
jgi:WD40 repeat protein